MEWQAVHDVFVAALEVEDDQRDAFIARETTQHPDVAREVNRLLRLHRAAGGFLETDPERVDADEQSLLTTGELVAERFEVHRLIGRGGMGEVYEARDRILGEEVALKVTRPTSRDPEARAEQFRKEVQLARRISHPGVCRVHDVAFHRSRDGQLLLVFTMELLVGETLAERLRQGPLPPDQARSIAIDIAAALDAAHAHDVLHGDIKPENVILVPRHDGSTRVVLTDFGLAKGLGGFEQTSARSGVMGTPAYMAPELFDGAPPSVASDVYAFALLTYRLLSSKDDLWRASRVLAVGGGETPRLPSGLSELDPQHQQVLSKALSPDPTRRFSSVVEFSRALFPQVPVRSRRLLILSAAALLVAVAALAVGPFFRWLRLSQEGLPPGRGPLLMLMTATDNRTNDPELDGMTELLRAQLAQSARLEVLPPETVPRVLREMRHDLAAPPDAQKLREVTLREGATLVVYSRVSLAGSAYRLNVRLEQVGARPSIVEREWQQEFAASDRQQLFDVVRRAAIWLRSTAGESTAQLNDQDRLPSEITTASWEALRLFAKAQESQAEGDSAKAIVYLEEAVRLDPEFVSAHARLGDVLISLRREREGFAAWQRAVELANRRQLTTREALRLRAQYLEDTGTLAEAEAASRAYALHYPADFDANIYLGWLIAEQGRIEEAIPWLEYAASVRPTAPSGHVYLSLCLIELERFDEAAAVADRLRQSTQPEWATWMSALISFARGHLQPAIERLEELRGTADRLWVSRFHTLHSSWLAEAGRLADAERELTAGVAFDTANGLRDRAVLKWLHLARLREYANDPAASADAATTAVTLSSDARTLARAGSQFARLGSMDEVRKIRKVLAGQPEAPSVRLALHRLDAELQLAGGRPDLAVQTLDEIIGAMRFTETRDFYVRALVAAGRNADAIAVLSDWARHPARFYAGPEPPLPGPWAAATDEYMRLLSRQGNDQEVSAWKARLLDFRQGQSGSNRK